TYQLMLPAQFSAMTNLKLTVAVGKTHLVIASAPELVREALALEEKKGGASAPSGDTAQAIEGLPSNLIFLTVSDPRDSLPNDLREFPKTLQASLGMMAAAQSSQAMAAAIPGAGPGAAGAPAPGGVPQAGDGAGIAGMKLRGGQTGLNLQGVPNPGGGA